jgi:hypothetical protein
MIDTPTYFLADEINLADLAAWTDLLPTGGRILQASCLADVFLTDAAGRVHMLEVSAGSISQIAASEDEFWRRCVDDRDGWLLRPLVDKCRAAGMSLEDHQCYAFTTLPFLGGAYEIENIWICSLTEWLSYTGLIYAQTKDLADGTTISIRFSKPH